MNSSYFDFIRRGVASLYASCTGQKVAKRNVPVEHYTTERVPNPNPRGATSWRAWAKVRRSLIRVCQRHGVTGPDGQRSGACQFYVVDDQYNDELYQYLEVNDREALSAAWISEVVAALRPFSGWGAGVSNIRFGYLIIFGDRLMVTGYPFAGCHDIESVAAAARANLQGVNGEEQPYTAEEFNRRDLLAATICGCYHCCAMYAPAEISAWTDEYDDGVGQTALCPRCGKSAVIAARPSFSLELEELQRISELAYGPLAGRVK